VITGADRQRIETLLQLRRWDEAMQLASGLLAQQPGDAALMLQLARAYSGAGRNEDAIRLARDAQSAMPEWDAPVRLEARLLLPTVPWKALRVARRAVELAPRSSTNWAVVALAAERQSLVAEADRAAAEARRLAPSSIEALNVSGLVALRRKDNVAAEQWFRRGLAIDPVNPDLLNNLALVLGRTGRGEEAMDLFERSLVQAPYGAHARRNLGITAAREVGRNVAWVLIGSIFVTMIGAAISNAPVTVVGAAGFVGSVALLTYRRRQLSEGRRSALKEYSGGHRPLVDLWRSNRRVRILVISIAVAVVVAGILGSKTGSRPSEVGPGATVVPIPSTTSP